MFQVMKMQTHLKKKRGSKLRVPMEKLSSENKPAEEVIPQSKYTGTSATVAQVS